MVHLCVGLTALVLGAWGMTAWWNDLGAALRGTVPLLLVLVGIAAIGASFQSSSPSAAPEEADDSPD